MRVVARLLLLSALLIASSAWRQEPTQDQDIQKRKHSKVIEMRASVNSAYEKAMHGLIDFINPRETEDLKTAAQSNRVCKSSAEQVLKAIELRSNVKFSKELLSWYPQIYLDLTKPDLGRHRFQVFQSIATLDIDKNRFEKDIREEDIAHMTRLLAEGKYAGLTMEDKCWIIVICGGGNLEQSTLCTTMRNPLKPRRSPIESTASNMLPFLKDESLRVRFFAVEALGLMGAAEHAHDISLLLKDENLFVRWNAVEALNAIGSKEHVKDVIALLADKESLVRGVAAISLVELGKRDAIPDELTQDIMLHRIWGQNLGTAT